MRINDKDYSITFSTYFNVEWLERRLYIDPSYANNSNMPQAGFNTRITGVFILLKGVTGYVR